MAKTKAELLEENEIMKSALKKILELADLTGEERQRFMKEKNIKHPESIMGIIASKAETALEEVGVKKER